MLILKVFETLVYPDFPSASYRVSSLESVCSELLCVYICACARYLYLWVCLSQSTQDFFFSLISHSGKFHSLMRTLLNMMERFKNLYNYHLTQPLRWLSRRFHFTDSQKKRSSNSVLENPDAIPLPYFFFASLLICSSKLSSKIFPWSH